MRTVLKGATKEVIIDSHGPVVVIGERINPTGRKKLAAALTEGNLEYVRNLALSQVAAGADVLDINVGVAGLEEVDLLPKVVEAVAAVVDVPLCLDSADPHALAAALPLAPGRAMVNSVNGGKESLQSILPIVKRHQAAVIGLTMDDNGIPNDPGIRTSIAERIIEHAAKVGLAPEDVVIDPLVLTVGADSNAASISLTTIDLLRRNLEVNINVGASNVSFGLPARQVINEAFLALAIQAGATCVISDPLRHCLSIRAVDLLLGRDPYASSYIGRFRMKAEESN